MGFVATLEEDFAAASLWLEQSLRLARSLAARFRVMRQCYLLGTARRLLGDYSAAADLFAEAASLVGDAGSVDAGLGMDVSSRPGG
jgi:hypothetical protein